MMRKKVINIGETVEANTMTFFGLKGTGIIYIYLLKKDMVKSYLLKKDMAKSYLLKKDMAKSYLFCLKRY
jgi:hypothetical protein